MGEGIAWATPSSGTQRVSGSGHGLFKPRLVRWVFFTQAVSKRLKVEVLIRWRVLSDHPPDLESTPRGGVEGLPDGAELVTLGGGINGAL